MLKGKARQSSAIERVSEGQEAFLRMLRDGTVVKTDWRQAAIMGGFGYICNVGTLSSPVAGGDVGLVVDIDCPSFLLSIPSGTSVLPTRVEVDVLLTLIAADANENEVLITIDQDKAWDSTGTSTAVAIYNQNTLSTLSSACTARRTFTATCTDPVHDVDLSHAQIFGDIYGSGGNAMKNSLRLLYEPLVSPVINGPAMLLVYWGGTVATSAFMACAWVELPTTVFKI